MASQRPLRTLVIAIAAVGAGAGFYGVAGALFAAGLALAYLITRRAAKWFAPDIDPEHQRVIDNNSSN